MACLLCFIVGIDSLGKGTGEDARLTKSSQRTLLSNGISGQDCLFPSELMSTRPPAMHASRYERAVYCYPNYLWLGLKPAH
jgi:hypothetical protein